MRIQLEEILQLTVLNILPPFWAITVYVFAFVLYCRDKIRKHRNEDSYNRNKVNTIGSIYFNRDRVPMLYFGVCTIIAIVPFLIHFNAKHQYYIEGMLNNIGVISSIVIGLTTVAVTLAVAIILFDKRYYLVFSIREVLQKYGFSECLIIVIFSCVISCGMTITLLDGKVNSFYDLVRFMTLEIGVMFNIFGVTYILWIVVYIVFIDQKAELSLLKQLYRRFWLGKIDTSHFKDKKSWSKEAVEINVEYLIKKYANICQKKKIAQIESIEFIANEKIFIGKWYSKTKGIFEISLWLLFAVSLWVNVVSIENKYLIILLELVNVVFILIATALTYLKSESVRTVIMRCYLDTQGYCVYTNDRKEMPIPRVAIRIDNIYDKYIMSMNSLNAFFDIWINYVGESEKQQIQEMYSEVIEGLEIVKNKSMVTYFPAFVIGYFLFDKNMEVLDIKSLYRNIVLPQNEQMFRRMLQSQLLYLSQESREDGNEYIEKIESYLKWLEEGADVKKGNDRDSKYNKKVSLILTTYNCMENLKTTMLTILSQDYLNIEIVIVDGASTDGTKELIEEYGRQLGSRLIWKSEPDKGIYDAMNKGYQMSTGDIIAFFNDRFMNDHVVSDMVKAIEDFGTDCIGAHADLVYMDGDRVVREWRMGRGCFRQGWMPGHPTLYLKREVYEQCGLYDTSYICSADYEFMIRALYGREDKLAYVPEVIVGMYYGGTSTQGLGSYLVSLKEGHSGLKKNGIKGAWWIDIRRTWKVLGQFVKARKG